MRSGFGLFLVVILSFILGVLSFGMIGVALSLELFLDSLPVWMWLIVVTFLLALCWALAISLLLNGKFEPILYLTLLGLVVSFLIIKPIQFFVPGLIPVGYIGGLFIPLLAACLITAMMSDDPRYFAD